MSDAIPALKDLKKQAKQELGGLEGLEGIGIGDQHLLAYVRDLDSAQRVPATFRGVALETVVTGEIASHESSH